MSFQIKPLSLQPCNFSMRYRIQINFKVDNWFGGSSVPEPIVEEFKTLTEAKDFWEGLGVESDESVSRAFIMDKVNKQPVKEIWN